MLKKVIFKFSEIPFVQKTLADNADLSAFRQRPTPRAILGISAIAVSYLIGWPLIGVLGALSIYLQNSFLLVVGGPVAYGLSHLVFLLGMYLAGAQYSWVLLRWLTRVVMSKLLKFC